MDDGASVIASVISGGDDAVEKAIFGTSEPEAIAAAVDAFCRAHLGAGIAGFDFYAARSAASRECARATAGAWC